MPGFTQPEEHEFSEIASILEKRYVKSIEVDPWAGSSFAWIRTRASRQKGKIAEELIEEWCRANHLEVSRSRNSEADRIINGKLVEIKFSTLWEGGFYKFQQIRDQRYDYIICLGLSPFAVHCWVIPKDAARKLAPSQHGGKKGKDTAWLTIYPNHPPEDIIQYGGSLKQALALIKRLSK